MRAVVLGEHQAEIQQFEPPAPKAGQLLINIKAACLNRADLHVYQGSMHGNIGGVGARLGLEWSGEVAAVGSDTSQFKPGDRVMGSGSGAFADHILTVEDAVYPIPDAMHYDEAATLPVALQTVHDAMVTHGELSKGQSVLIQGASSGMGLMALQVARFLDADTIIGTSTTQQRRDALVNFGADHSLNSKDADWVEQTLSLTNGEGVDLVIDFLAGPLMNQNLRATKMGGRIINVGRMAGNTGEFDFDLHALRRIIYKGVTFRTRSPKEVLEVIRAARAALIPALETGALSLPIDSKFPLEQVNEAFARMAANQHLGKIVLTMEASS